MRSSTQYKRPGNSKVQAESGDVSTGDVSGVSSHFTPLVFIVLSGAACQTSPVPRWRESRMWETGQLSHTDGAGTADTWHDTRHQHHHTVMAMVGTKYFNSCCLYVIAVAAADHEHFKSGRGDSGDSHRRGAAPVETQAADGVHWRSSWHQSGPSPEVVRTWLNYRGASCGGGSYVSLNEWRKLSILVCAGSRLSRKCYWKCVSSCRNCETRARNTAQMPPTSLVPWRILKILPCTCAWNFCQSETLCWTIQYMDTDAHVRMVETFCCVCLQRSSRGEATCHDELATATSDTEDHGAIHSVSEVRRHRSVKRQCHSNSEHIKAFSVTIINNF